jgi:hypothetical protein
VRIQLYSIQLFTLRVADNKYASGTIQNNWIKCEIWGERFTEKAIPVSVTSSGIHQTLCTAQSASPIGGQKKDWKE